MTTEIFADSLIAVNFSMDFLALFITGKLTHSAIRPLRLAVSALLGAVFATLMVVFDSTEPIVRLIWWLAFVSCAAAMCAISYNGSIYREIPVFIAVNLGLGGIMSVLFGWVKRSGLTIQSEDSGAISPLMFALFAAISGVVSLIYGRIRSGSVKRREALAELEYYGRRASLRLLSDSGNLLVEPMSGRPVVICSPEKLRECIGEDIDMLMGGRIDMLPDRLSRSVRLIPARGIGDGRLLTGFIPDSIKIDGRAVDAVIAAAESDFGGCDGIVPDILLI